MSQLDPSEAPMSDADHAMLSLRLGTLADTMSDDQILLIVDLMLTALKRRQGEPRSFHQVDGKTVVLDC